MERGTIVVVDDEPNIADLVDLYLARDGFRVLKAATGEAGLEAVQTHRPRLVVLDVGLPDIDGLEVCRRLRQTSQVPVIFLTARDGEVDRVLGLELGGDDYLTKPFDMQELTARVEALLRRAPVAEASGVERYHFGDVEIDFRKAEVTRAGQPIDLSALEFKLLQYFIEHRGATLSRDELLNRVWGYDAMPYSRTVDVHVSGLRQKIEPNPGKPRYVVTVHRLGYKFVG